jgi:hypothetical protein
MEDNGVAMVDKECTGHRKIARLDIPKRVVEELIGVRPPMGVVRLGGREGFLAEEIDGQG